MLTFGCKISYAIWDRFVRFLHWSIVDRLQNSSILHYLVGLLFCDREHSISNDTLDTFRTLYSNLVVPVANDKYVYPGPHTFLLFEGIKFSTQDITLILPEEKICEISDMTFSETSCY